MGGFSFALFPPLHAAAQPRHSPRNDRGISRQGKPERRRTEPLQRLLCWGAIWILETSKMLYRATQRAHRASIAAHLAFSGIVFLLKRNSNQFNILQFSRLLRPCFWSWAFYISNPNRAYSPQYRTNKSRTVNAQYLLIVHEKPPRYWYSTNGTENTIQTVPQQKIEYYSIKIVLLSFLYCKSINILPGTVGTAISHNTYRYFTWSDFI